MKKSVMKLLVGLATTGMLMATGAIGVQSIGVIEAVGSVETVEYKMESNENPGYQSFIIHNEETDYKYFSDLEKSLKKGNAYARVKLNGRTVLLVGRDNIDFDRHAYHVKVYTEKSGRNVKCLGELYFDDPIRIYDGVLYCRNAFGSGPQPEFVYESFYVSDNGERLIEKDYINAAGIKDGGLYYGYTNCNERGNFHSLSGKEDAEKAISKFNEKLKKAKMIEFNIKGM